MHHATGLAFGAGLLEGGKQRVEVGVVVIGILLAGWFFFPADGLAVGDLNLRFPSLADDLDEGKAEAVNVDAVMSNVRQSYDMTCSETMFDSLVFFRDYLKENPNRIYLPNDDYTYFDSP